MKIILLHGELSAMTEACLADGSDDHVADVTVSAGRAAENTDAFQFFRAGVIRNAQIRFLPARSRLLTAMARGISCALFQVWITSQRLTETSAALSAEMSWFSMAQVRAFCSSVASGAITAAGAGFPDSLTGALDGEEKYEVRFFLLDALGELEKFLYAG